ncbi:beta-glucoside-specific PTS transporter subunit IIABC [Priestia aryabhattai]|uniref:beta-glucoside-specific PTS transporter subunit IIABC n=1 Tax=Priestia aryabhattai TaxID=412384 RepID=UPI00398245D2
MDYKKTATDILKYVGGEKNVVHLGHCATRLRFTIADDSKVNLEALKKIHGVLDVVMAAQCQVIIGNNVMEVYDELLKLGKLGQQNTDNIATGKKKVGAIVLDFIVSVFQPLVPVMAGAGILKSMLILLSMFNLIDKDGDTFVILTSISNAVFYFLPIFIALTTATKLKANHLVAAAAMSILLFPDMITLSEKGASLLSVPITNVNYTSQVFPSILGVIFYAYMERFFTKISPKPIRVFFVPMMSLLLTVPVTLVLLGPLGFKFGAVFTAVILFVFNKFGWIAVGLLAAALPFIVSTGMHKAAMPYIVSSFTGLGKEMLFAPALLAHNISQSGASFAVSLRTKDKELKSISLSAGISALFGITEPALYGVTLQKKSVLTSVIISCLIGGLFIGLFAVTSFTMVNPSVASITQFIDPSNSKNFIFALAGLAISFFLSFAITLILWKEDKIKDECSIKDEDKETVGKVNEDVNIGDVVSIKQPVKGEVIPLTEVKDAVFSTKVMGDGIAVIPSKGELYAPVDGEIKMVFSTNHAIGMETPNGSELLFHIGIDTVQLGGKYFESQVKEGDKVKVGDLLVKFDLQKIIEEGYDPATIAVVTNKDKYSVRVVDVNANNNDTLMFITAI